MPLCLRATPFDNRDLLLLGCARPLLRGIEAGLLAGGASIAAAGVEGGRWLVVAASGVRAAQAEGAAAGRRAPVVQRETTLVG